jgi:UTP--glucose-1-phosphate uridylyltransferase
MSVLKVVIPVAGLGTRLLPTTKALPKEMLPVGRYPAIQHVVEEMAAADLKKVLFVTSRSKTIIENQFDNNVDVVLHLEQNQRLQDLGDFDYSRRGIEFFYTRQQAPPGSTKPQGTGAAVAAAQSFVDDEHFVVAYGDTIINTARTPNFIGRMMEAHLSHGASCTVGVRPVSAELISSYGVVQPAPGESTTNGSFSIDDILEKPDAGSAPSNMAVSARYIFGPEIFDQIRKLQPSDNGEIGITDAIRGLIREGRTVRAVSLKEDERRYDIGSHTSYYKAFIDFALRDPQCGEAVRTYLKACVDSGGAPPPAD